MRKVISVSYCIPRDIAKWLEALAKKKRRSKSSLITELLLEIKDHNNKADK